MDRQQLLVTQLRLCEEHLARREWVVARQTKVVADLNRAGDHALLAVAKDLLATFERVLADTIAERDRLKVRAWVTADD